jgi:hypothetical protein
MKSKKYFKSVFVIFSLGLLLTFTLIPNHSDAALLKFGKWVAVYEGGSTPHHWECVSQWFTNACYAGDIKVANN